MATRSRDDNGLGLTTANASAEIASLLRFFKVLTYTPEVLEAWRRLVVAHAISGKQTHDAHIVAIMQVNSVTQILTFNSGHFERFPDLTILNPAQI